MLFTEDVPYLLGNFLKNNSAPASNEEWVQIINQELSPKFWEFAMTFGFTTIEPLIQKIFKQNNLPNIHLKFTKLDLGDVAPKIANLGGKYLVFVPSHSVKMREFSFLSFLSFLRKVC